MSKVTPTPNTASGGHSVAAPSLLHKAADGDQEAIAECIKHLAPVVYTLAKRQLNDDAKAYELTLDVFSELWQNLHEFDQSQQDAKTFTALLARRKLAEYDRQQQAKLTAAAKTQHAPPVLQPLSKAALEQYVATRALVEGRSAGQIAQELGTDEASVRTLAHTILLRARAKLIKRTVAP